MYRVPVMTYLSLAGDVRLNEFKLKHQRIADGDVVFETAREIERLTLLLDSHNTGVPMPHSEVEYDGPTLVNHLDVLSGVRRMNDDWYSCQCPSCAAGGRDNKKNNLQFSAMGFRCMAGCSGKDVLTSFTALLPASVEVDLERGQTVLELDKEPSKKRVMKVDEDEVNESQVVKEGRDYILTLTKTKLGSGKVTTSVHRVQRSNLRRLWFWLIKNYSVGDTAEYDEIRSFMAEQSQVPVDTWGAHGEARKIYFATHYYPLKVLQHLRCIEYHKDGSLTLLRDTFEEASE